ncbi:MAG: DNA primase, partial [Arenimonas sp.]
DPDSIVRQEGAEGFDARLQQATPLSQFFFDEISKDISLGSMEGKARLSERAKPMLAKIPDGAFADLMMQRLSEMTGLQQRNNVAQASAQTNVPRRNTAPPPKLSLVRAAITLLLQQPSLALHIEPPHLFAILRQPGIPLLCELIALIRNRPDINTGLIIESFDGREEQASLQKLAAQEFPGEPEHWQAEFNDALQQLDKQTRMQRIEELNAKTGRSSAENNELRELLAARMR